MTISFKSYVYNRIMNNHYYTLCPLDYKTCCIKDKETNCYICPIAEKEYDAFKKYCEERRFEFAFPAQAPNRKEEAK